MRYRRNEVCEGHAAKYADNSCHKMIERMIQLLILPHRNGESKTVGARYKQGFNVEKLEFTQKSLEGLGLMTLSISPACLRFKFAR